MEQSIYLTTLLKLVEARNYDPTNLEIGENISTFPGVKIAFDGYAYTPQGEEDKNIETYGIFIHKDSAKRHFVFPEHETETQPYGEQVVHRPDVETVIMAYHNLEKDSWTFNAIETATEGEEYMKPEVVLSVLSAIYDKHYS